MDLIVKLTNIVFPPIVLMMLLLLLPPYLVCKVVSSAIRSIFSEDVAGKVVLITGASSGIGEHLAYEYARRRACLVLTARREDRLRKVADKARHLGSPDVMVIRADVSNVEDSKRLVHEATTHFGRLDHLVNNAGINLSSMLENLNNFSDFASVMDINFWGSVYTTHFAVPHLRKSKGKIVGIASIAGWFPCPKTSIYSASKAAQITFYDNLRVEFGSDIGITIVNPGLIQSEMTQSATYSEAHVDFIPLESTEACAKAILDSTCRGERSVTEPSWFGVLFLFKLLCPEALEWISRWLFITRLRTLEKDTASNKLN